MDTLALHHVTPEVRHLPLAVRTAKAAAEALGVTPAEIANSLVFVSTTPRRRRAAAARARLRRATGSTPTRWPPWPVSRASSRPTRRSCASTPGSRSAASPRSATPTHLRTIIDVTLGRYATVWAAAGHSHSVFATTYDELIRITGGQPMDVA